MKRLRHYLLPLSAAALLTPSLLGAAPVSDSKRCEWGSPCWFEEFESLFNRPMHVHSGLYTFRSASRMSEDEKNYLISIDLPGVDKKEINLEVVGNRILVAAERKEEKETKEKSAKSYSSFKQSFSLPEDADLSKIAAASENGVLKITVPKTGKKVSKKITIQ